MTWRTDEALAFLAAVRSATREDLQSAFEVVLWEFAERHESYMPGTLRAVMRRLAQSVAAATRSTSTSRTPGDLADQL